MSYYTAYTRTWSTNTVTPVVAHNHDMLVNHQWRKYAQVEQSRNSNNCKQIGPYLMHCVEEKAAVKLFSWVTVTSWYYGWNEDTLKSPQQNATLNTDDHRVCTDPVV